MLTRVGKFPDGFNSGIFLQSFMGAFGKSETSNCRVEMWIDRSDHCSTVSKILEIIREDSG